MLAHYICDLFNEATSSFPQEMLKALVIVLPKPRKDPIMPHNFKPISLFNADQKLYAEILASRLMTIIPSLIDRDQAGFVRGHQSSDATRRLINITHLARNSGMSSLLLSLDAEKSFDRVHWGYLRALLAKFSFSDRTLSAIMAFYLVPSVDVYVAEMLSSPFCITNGTRQGCPLSPLIFDLAMEPLEEHVRASNLISGFYVENTELKISLFADNVIFMLTNPQFSLETVQLLLNKFSEVSTIE